MYAAGFIIYQLGILLYRLILLLASPFNQRAKAMLKGRVNWKFKLKETLITEKRKRIWYHCASLGEFEQIRPLLEQMKMKYPEYAVVLTFFSPSGFEQRKNYKHADYIFYLPFDGVMNARYFIDNVQPELSFFAKYDIWYHYLNELEKRSIPTFLVSANFRSNQIYFKPYGLFFRKMLKAFKIIFSQFETSTLLLQQHGISQAITSGDTRYDNVIERAALKIDLPIIAKLAKENALLVMGSSYTQEEALVAASLFKQKGYKVITAPHHIQEERLLESESIFSNFKVMRYSQATSENISDVEVLLIDNIGLLGSIYHYADLAFVGGGFGKNGIHNILEPLSHGVPVLIGPLNHIKFPETKLAMDAGVCFAIQNTDELNSFYETNKMNSALHLKCANFVDQNSGATLRVLAAITR